MGIKRSALKGSAVVALGEGLGFAASFIRNMILARALPKADFGIAATFAMVITLLEVSAKMGIARFLVRDKEGNEPEFLAAAHFLHGVAALASCALIAALAWPIAHLFGIREHATALLALALIPLLHGFGHLDVRRFERTMRFGPATWIEAGPQLVITALAWPVAVWLGDYRSVLLLLVLKALLSWTGSFLFAERPYRWLFHREYVTRMLRFGWPLILNGFLMFAVMRGDQFVVATFYPMEELAAFAAAASLALAPILLFSRVFASVMLPVLAKAQDDPAVFERRYRLILAFMSAFSAAYAMGLIVAAEPLMQFAFGSKYAGAGLLLAWLAAANALRNVRRATAIAAIAKGDSVNELYSNLSGGVALLPALAIGFLRDPVWMIAAVGLLGEFVACWVAFRRLSRRDGVPLATSLVPSGLVLLIIAAAGALHLALEHQPWPMPVMLLLGIAAALTGSVAVLLILPASRQQILLAWRRGRARGWKSLLFPPKPAAP
ncbi:MAG: oligosaccharide flippase family protein [Verrucomicrobiae bacterium]|nr:oligosaccharide flippase family protein [Verrucomicrobiae bacterium]